VALALGTASSAAPRQDQSSTTTSAPTISTTDNLLESNTTVPPTTAEPPASTAPVANDGSPGGDETRTVWLIVAALVLIGLMLGFLTFRYWQRTAPGEAPPVRPDEPPRDRPPRSGGAPEAASRPRPRQSRQRGQGDRPRVRADAERRPVG
jgi:hypothetical protein